MSIKFSQFNAVSSISSSGYIVGYDGANNIRIKTSTADRLFAFTGGSLQFTQLTNAMVPANTIGIDKLVNLAGLSVLGNATNASAAMSAITAANDNEVLLRSGTSLVFSKIGTDNINNSAITFAKIQNITPQRFVGRNSSPAGPPEEVNISQALEWLSSTANTIAYRNGSAWAALTASTDGYVLRLSGGALGFGQIDYNSISFTATQRVLGRNTAGAGTSEEVTTAQILEWLSSTQNTIAYRNASAWTTLTATSNGQVLRLTGGALGFGQIATAGIEDAAVTYAKIQNVSATSRVLGRKTAGAGVIEELTTSELLDFISSTQGSILYRGASGWVALGPGTSGQVLQTNGASADPSWATSTSGGIGGSTGATDNLILRADGTGGATLQNSDLVIDDATTSTQANVTLANVHSGQTNSAFVLSPKGTGAFILGPKPDGTATGGNARGANSVDLQTVRSAANQVPSAPRCFIGGGQRNIITDTESGTIAGYGNSIASPYSAAGGFNNTISAGGGSSALFGESNSVGASHAAAFGAGSTNTVNGYSAVFGRLNNASQTYVFVSGYQALANFYGVRLHGNGQISRKGDNQRGDIAMWRSFQGNTQFDLFLDGSSAKPTMQSNGVWNFTVSVVAVMSVVGTGGTGTLGDSYAITLGGCIKRIGNTTALVGTIQTIMAAQSDTSMSSSVVTVTADDTNTNECLRIQFTPPTTAVSNTTIRVNARVDFTEIGY